MEKGLKPVSTHITAALELRNYRLQKQSQTYNSHIPRKIARWASKKADQMKAALFKRTDPSSVLCFLKNIKTACGSKSFHENAAMWLFPHIIGEPIKAALSNRVTDDERNRQHNEKPTTYCQVVRYLLETYATDDVIAEAKSEITTFKQPASMTTVWYSKVFWEKTLRSGMSYNKP